MKDKTNKVEVDKKLIDALDKICRICRDTNPVEDIDARYDAFDVARHALFAAGGPPHRHTRVSLVPHQ